VAQTLQAALADHEAALAVGSGRLVRALTSTGFEPPDLSGAVAGDRADDGARPGSTTHGAAGRAPPLAERDITGARRELDLAERTSALAQAELRAVEGRQADLAVRSERLERELDELRDRAAVVARDLATASTQAREGRHDRDRASRAEVEAARALARAREALG